MKSAVFLYNTQSGKCKIGHCTASICTVFRAYGYDIKPQLIDFCVAHMANEQWPPEQVRAHMEAVVPNLKHWKKE